MQQADAAWLLALGGSLATRFAVSAPLRRVLEPHLEVLALLDMACRGLVILLDILVLGHIEDVPSLLMEGTDVDLPDVQICVAVISRARVWFNSLFCEILPVALEALLVFLGFIPVRISCAGSEEVQGFFAPVALRVSLDLACCLRQALLCSFSIWL